MSTFPAGPGIKTRALWQGAVLLGVPALFVAFLIDRRSMWLDEATSVYIASKSIPQMLDTLRHIDAVFALYYFVLHFWMGFGESALAVRILSAIFAIATLPVFYAIARRMYSTEAAFLATFALGTSFMFLRYAVETRTYAMEFFFCALAALYFLKMLDKQSAASNALAYITFNALAIYAHPLALLWPAAHAASLGILRVGRRAWLTFGSCWAAIAVLLLPLAAAVRLNGAHQIDWIAPITLTRFGFSLNQLLGGLDGGPLHRSELTAIGIILIAVGCRAGWQTQNRRFTLMLVLWLVLPLTIMGIVSIWKPIEQIYYFRYTLIPAFVLIGAGLDWIRKRAGLPAFAVALTLFACGGIVQAFTYEGEDWRAATAFLQSHAVAGDGLVVHTAPVLRALDYAERERGQAPAADVISPATLDTWGLDGLRPLPANVPREAARGYSRVWLVLSHRKSDWERDALAPMRRYYTTASVTKFQFIEIVELRRRAAH